MRPRSTKPLAMTAALLCLPVAAAFSTVCTWGGGSGNWSDGAKWTNGVPGPADDAVIHSGSVLIDSPSAELNSFTLTGGTLTFSNWATRVAATTVTLNGGTITHAGPYNSWTNSVWPEHTMSNRVWIACSNLTLSAAASIDVDQKGYAGGVKLTVPTDTYDGHGPGGSSFASGGSHGGPGGSRSWTAGPVYGAASAPLAPGSGGGATHWSTGRNGGGAVRIDATGHVTIDGVITADGGQAGTRGGSGSGGSVFISCRTFESATGSITAEGRPSLYLDYGGGGGGGRIAVVYNSAAQAALPVPAVYVSASPGTLMNAGELGTLYFTDNRLLEADQITYKGLWSVPGTTSYAFDGLVISNGWLRFAGEDFVLTVENDLTLVGNNAAYDGNFYYSAGRLELHPASLVCSGAVTLVGSARLGLFSIESNATLSSVWIGGDLTLDTNAYAEIESPLTNNPSAAAGMDIRIAGALNIASNARFFVRSHPTNGACISLTAFACTVDAGGLISADSRGFRGGPPVSPCLGYGPGYGKLAGGGSYGGLGGYSPSATYGSSNTPVHAGSGGGGSTAGNSRGGAGGGNVRLTVSRKLVVNGTISADGQAASAAGGVYGGGGSGGGVYVRSHTLDGAGMLRARGGRGGTHSTSGGGGGGGGRIAIWRVKDGGGMALQANVDPGFGTRGSGETGTVVWVSVPPVGTVVIIR